MTGDWLKSDTVQQKLGDENKIHPRSVIVDTLNRIWISVIIVFAFPGFASISHAQNQQEILTKFIAELQKNPNDNTLREKIIKHVQTMSPAPAVPEEAKRYLARGKAAFKGAKETIEFNESAEEFKKALLAAPWLADGYYNLGIVQDKAGQYAAAMENLRLYTTAAPNASDLEKVKELIYEIEYRKEKVAKESSPATEAERKMKEDNNFIRKLNGAKFVRQFSDAAYPNPDCGGGNFAGEFILEIQGNEIVYGVIYSSVPRCFENDNDHRKGVWRVLFHYEIKDRGFLMPRDEDSCGLGNKVRCSDVLVNIGEDSILLPVNDELQVYRRKY